MFREGLERTTTELAASTPSATKIKVAAPPDLEVPAPKRLIRAYQPHIFRSPSWQNGHVLDALVGELPCHAHEKTGGCGRGASGHNFDSCVMGFVYGSESMEKRLSVCRQIAPRLVFLATVAVLLQQSFCFTSHLHPFLNGTNLRRLHIAMGQYSSSCVSAVVLTLGVVDIEDGVWGREQVD